MKTRTIFWTVLTISAVLSGCAFTQKTAVVGGVQDLIYIPKGSVIAEIPLPTDETKRYNVVTPKAGFWISLAGWNRIIKVDSGSSPLPSTDKNPPQ